MRKLLIIYCARTFYKKKENVNLFVSLVCFTCFFHMVSFNELQVKISPKLMIFERIVLFLLKPFNSI